MFHRRSANNIKINKLHYSALRLMYDDYPSTFEELLEKDNSLTVHHFSIETTCIELYEFYNNLSQAIFSELFVRNRSNCNLRPQSNFVIPEAKTVYKGSNSR